MNLRPISAVERNRGRTSYRASTNRPSKGDRRGIATVEFAFVLPVLLILTLGTIDVCSLIFLKESVVLASYEGARQGVNRGQTNATCTARVKEFLDARNVSYEDAGIQISDPGFDGADTLEHVTVTVSVPTAGNLPVPTWIFGDMMVTGSCTMRKEYANLNTSP